MPSPSKIFTGYRALGLVSNHVPLSVRYIQRRKENLVCTVVGKSFHTYGCSKLDLLSVSDPCPEEIECLTSDAYLVFTVCKNIIYAWRRGTELKHVYKGHEENVHILLPFGPHLLSVDRNSTLMIWDIKSEENVLQIEYSNATFCITTLLHPSTYLNKVLIGSRQGRLELRNIRTNKVIYTFAGWGKAVTVLEQAPALNVVAIGLESGDIYVHNLKIDESLMKFTQEWGPVTAISFRSDGSPIMATASDVGHIALWNLEKKRLDSEIRDAHRSSVTGMKFLPKEPLLVTSSPDNTLKIWIFDMPDDSGRLLRLREGHNKPSLKIRFHGSAGMNVLSAGLDSTLRSFSTVADQMNKSLGQASYNRKVAKKRGVQNDPGKMPPINDFTAEITREKEWDNIAACHRGLSIVTTWSYDHSRMGDHKILHDRFKGQKNVTATCITLTACGNFTLIGYDTGHVDMFNIQSGQFRGTYGVEKAHDGIVRGVATDGLNQVTVSGGSDKILKFWQFKEKTLLAKLNLEWGIAQVIIHRESSLVAVALDNFSVVIVDIWERRVVRVFSSHEGRITDMAFCPDAHWLTVASTDCTIRTWHMSTGQLIDCFLVSSICTSLSVSPNGEFLATAHAGDLGIYLWSNATLYSYVSLHPLPEDYKPLLMDLPSVSMEGENFAEESGEDGTRELNDEIFPEFQSPEQISDKLVTLSLLPQSHWRSLIHLDLIKERNKPKEPAKAPKSAPFFLPTTEGLKPSFRIDLEDTTGDNKTSKLKNIQGKSRFQLVLQQCSEANDYKLIFEELKLMNPPSIDSELRCLSPENGGSIDLMLSFMKALNQAVKSHKDAELVQAYFSVFNKIHMEQIASERELRDFLSELEKTVKEFSEHFQRRFNSTLCAIRYVRSAVLKHS